MINCSSRLAQEGNLNQCSSTSWGRNQKLMYGNRIITYKTKVHWTIGKLILFIPPFLRGLRSIKVKSRWEGEDVHILFLSLCKATALEVQPPLSQERCQLLLCRHTTIQKLQGLVLVDYSRPESEKKQYFFGCRSYSELTAAIYSAHILHAENF